VFASPSITSTEKQLSTYQGERTNQLWLDELRGSCGLARQKKAYLDLANYLYKVAYNYLLKRQSDIPLLSTQMSTELAALAQDSAQDVLMKISANNGKLLEQYQERGRFLGWMALIIRNHVAGYLRRPPYNREVPQSAEMGNIAKDELPFENRATLEEIGVELQKCLDALPVTRREALIRCILLGERSKVVATQLNRTVNAIDQLVWHAKRQVRECLHQKGIGADVLNLF